jgi:hypothetical protein
MLHEFSFSFTHNLFTPLLLSYSGFLVPDLRVKLDFPHIIYQGLTIYLLFAFGRHGGEELTTVQLCQAGGFMAIGLFALLCGAASCIAVPAIRRLAIPEANPTLPLATSLGLTFPRNVAICIPV